MLVDPSISPTTPDTPYGFTVADLARRYRVGEDKVRSWIKAGELAAINTSATMCGKPRFVVTPDALFAFEQRRSVSPPKKQQRRKRKAEIVDFYPD
jgi:hypothetical protein